MTTTETSVRPTRSRRYRHGDAFDPHAIDSRLVSAVQVNAGARCHEAANLLHCYGMASRAYELAACGDDGAAEDFKQSERALRRFLFECRRQTLNA
jgi:hypothetical protein